MNLRVTKIFDFETAHVLWGYDGKCKNIHGHSYKLTVTISGPLVNDLKEVKNGMIIDFSDLKKIVKSNVVEPFDHCLLVNGQTPHKKYTEVENGFSKIMLCDYQPTAENMLIDMVQRISTNLPDHVQLKYAKLQETENSFVEWLAEENGH
ncbi:6-carboxytetrahydropterin synthase QueD [Putridiphycobacter roseus]|uniref:6-carboxy-5,6,7,8-tetrahydropterin synthase n=1 Tax=Putridiphycobacter roseus TaxID=2219161 RepID=A0A2W1NP84_9FLAO|nr:6-carboxytetrahydropterin synthase [Putridiphycobacter roseus]PZE16428.1 6-carboxytetrahydropterin synthase QueD [Putridiphycobacter roseus]